MNNNSIMPVALPLYSPPIEANNEQLSEIISAVKTIRNTAEITTGVATLTFAAQPETTTLSQLPPEIRRLILKFMSAETRQILASVSPKWSDAYQIDNSYLSNLPVNVKERIFSKLDVKSRVNLLVSSGKWRAYYKGRPSTHNALIKRQKDGREVRFNLNSAIPSRRSVRSEQHLRDNLHRIVWAQNTVMGKTSSMPMQLVRGPIYHYETPQICFPYFIHPRYWSVARFITENYPAIRLPDAVWRQENSYMAYLMEKGFIKAMPQPAIQLAINPAAPAPLLPNPWLKSAADGISMVDADS